jgi:hypothetical protein
MTTAGTLEARLPVTHRSRTPHRQFAIHSPDVPDNWVLLVVIAAALSATGIGICLVRALRRAGSL